MSNTARTPELDPRNADDAWYIVTHQDEVSALDFAIAQLYASQDGLPEDADRDPSAYGPA